MNSGIYEIVNTTNGKRYIGSAVNFCQRWHKHRSHLRHGIHSSKHLQAAWRKYGEPTFNFSKLLVCSKENLIIYEQIAIDSLNPEYNVCRKAGSPLGVKHPPEFGAAISARNTGVPRPKSEAHRKKLSAVRLGKKFGPQSPLHRANNAAANGGFTIIQAQSIRAEYDAGSSQADIARALCIDPSRISRLVAGKTYI